MESKDVTDKLRCVGGCAKLINQKSNLLEDVVRSKIMALVHSPEVTTWLQTHQRKRYQRRPHISRGRAARHSASTDSRDSSTMRHRESCLEDIIESPSSLSDKTTVHSSSAHHAEESLAFYTFSSTSSDYHSPELRGAAEQSVLSCHLAPAERQSLEGDNANDSTPVSAMLRLSDICGSGIWSKAGSAFVSVIGAKSSGSRSSAQS